MVSRKLGADGAITIFLLHVGGAANKLVACLIKDKKSRVAPDIGHGAIDDGVILEFRHARQLDTTDHTILHGDLGVAINLSERQRQRSKIEINVPHRPVGKSIRQ